MSITTQESTSDVSSETEATLESPINITLDLPSFNDLIPEAIQPYWALIQQYPLLEWVSIVFTFWLLAYVIRRYGVSLIQRLASKTENSLDDDIINCLRPPLFTIVVWFGVIIATQSAGFEYILLKYLPNICLLYTSPSPRDLSTSRMPSSA